MIELLTRDVRDGVPLAPDGKRYRACITSPPYFRQRDYGHDAQIGREKTVEAFVAEMVTTFRAVRDVLAEDGTLWLNLGDTVKDRHLLGVPWRTALALVDDGWRLASEVIWHKPKVMPESCTDRFVRDHEHLFVLSVSKRRYFDVDAVREPNIWADKDKRAIEGRKEYAKGSKNEGVGVSYNSKGKKRRTVWRINPSQSNHPHLAPFPEALVEPCVLAGSQEGDWVLDPFCGSGTTLRVAERLGRHAVGIDVAPMVEPFNGAFSFSQEN